MSSTPTNRDVNSNEGASDDHQDPQMTALIQEERDNLLAQNRIEEQMKTLKVEQNYLRNTQRYLLENEAADQQCLEQEETTSIPHPQAKEGDTNDVTGQMKELSLEEQQESITQQRDLTLKSLEQEREQVLEPALEEASAAHQNAKRLKELEQKREEREEPLVQKMDRLRAIQELTLEGEQLRLDRLRVNREVHGLDRPRAPVRRHVYGPDNEPVRQPSESAFQELTRKGEQLWAEHHQPLPDNLTSRGDGQSYQLYPSTEGEQSRLDRLRVNRQVHGHDKEVDPSTQKRLDHLRLRQQVARRQHEKVAEERLHAGQERPVFNAPAQSTEHPLLRSCPPDEHRLLRSPDNELCCSLTRKPFRDPVVHPSGITYERDAIQEKDPQAVCYPNCTLEAYIASKQTKATNRPGTKERVMGEKMLCCPLTGGRLRNPVIDPEGHTYEQFAIAQFVHKYGKSPLTNAPLKLKQLYDNATVKALIVDQDKQEEGVKCILVRDLGSEHSPPPYCSCDNEHEREMFLQVATKCMGSDPPNPPSKFEVFGGHRTAYHDTHRLLYRMDKRGICYCVITRRTIAWTVAVELLREVVQCLDSVRSLQDEDMNGLQRVQTPEGKAIVLSLCQRFSKPNPLEDNNFGESSRHQPEGAFQSIMGDLKSKPGIPQPASSRAREHLKGGSKEIASILERTRIARIEDETVITELALHNYEIFHGMSRGSACYREVAGTSAGIQGWAACAIDDVVVDKPPEDKEATQIEKSAPNTEKPPAAKKAKTRGDEEEEEMLKRAMMESVLEARGVRPPQRPIIPDPAPYYDSDSSATSCGSCMDDDDASYVYDDDDGSQACSECPEDEGYSNEEETCSQGVSNDEALNDEKEEEEEQSLDPSKSDDSWSQLSKQSSHLSDPVVVDSCNDASSQQSASSGFSAYDFLE